MRRHRSRWPPRSSRRAGPRSKRTGRRTSEKTETQPPAFGTEALCPGGRRLLSIGAGGPESGRPAAVRRIRQAAGVHASGGISFVPAAEKIPSVEKIPSDY